MANKNLAEVGKKYRFTSENQPVNGRKGSKNRSTIAKMVLSLPSSAIDPKGRGLLITDPDTGKEIQVDIETAMAIRVAAKAVASGDASAYAALMDSAYGKNRIGDNTPTEQATTGSIDLGRLTTDELTTFTLLLNKAKGLNPDGSRPNNNNISEAEIVS